MSIMDLKNCRVCGSVLLSRPSMLKSSKKAKVLYDVYCPKCGLVAVVKEPLEESHEQ